MNHMVSFSGLISDKNPINTATSHEDELSDNGSKPDFMQRIMSKVVSKDDL